MPFTTNRLYSVQATGSNAGTWGAGTTNSLNEGVMEVMDANMGGKTVLSLSSTTPQLLSQTQANNGLLRLTGALLANIVISPDAGVTMSGFFFFENITTGNFTVTFTNAGGSVVLPQSRRGVMWIDTTYGPRILAVGGSGSADPIPVGTTMVFYQTSVPTGWTLSTALNDCAIRLVSTTGGSTGGVTGFTTAFSVQSFTPSGTNSFTGIVSNTGWGSSSSTGSGRLMVSDGGALPGGAGTASGANSVQTSSNSFTGNLISLPLNVSYANFIVGIKS